MRIWSTTPRTVEWCVCGIPPTAGGLLLCCALVEYPQGHGARHDAVPEAQELKRKPGIEGLFLPKFSAACLLVFALLCGLCRRVLQNATRVCKSSAPPVPKRIRKRRLSQCCGGGDHVVLKQIHSWPFPHGEGLAAAPRECCENQSERLFCKHLNYPVVKN